MKISIITVCLNSEDTIADTLKSVNEQDYPNYEHILFDGGSTDGTLEIIEAYKDRVTLVQGNDSGIFDAMNQALQRTTGDIIGILNSDDFYAHRKVLSSIASYFENNDIDSVYGDMFYVYRHQVERVYRVWKSGVYSRTKFHFGWTIPHPAFFLRKSIYDRYGAYNENFKFAGDYEFAIRILYEKKISTAYIPEVLVKMRVGGSGNGSLSKNFNTFRECYKALKKSEMTFPLLTALFKPCRRIPQMLLAKLSKWS